MSEGRAQKWAYITLPEVYKVIDELQEVDCAIHFRMAIHGDINKANTHPFKLKNRAWLMHNGVLGKYATPKGAKKSDTVNFVETFCNKQIAEHGSIPRAALEKEITGNAICIMLPDGNISRYGHGWNQYDGAWFSNSYAWDKPGTTKYLTRAYSDYTEYEWSDYGGKSYDYVAGADDATGTILADRLEPISDSLPLNVPDYISYDDMDIYDDLQAGTIDADTFVYSCSSTTLANLYAYAADYGLISY
jgi:hypothetical protein